MPRGTISRRRRSPRFQEPKRDNKDQFGRKQCVKGFHCGEACVTKSKACNSQLGEAGQALYAAFSDFIKRAS